jgi:DNA topoisomerase-1
VVSKLLVRLFPNIFDVEFTSRMEGELDRVEEGRVDWRGLLASFYPGFRERLEAGEASSESIIKEILAADGETCDKCGRPMLVRWNKFGRFLGCSGYPECRGTRSLDGPPPEGRELGVHPQVGRAVRAKVGPYGPYVELAPESADEKPKRVSLPEGADVATVALDYAVKLLSLPRTVGIDPASGAEIVAGLGRYGPFVRRDKTFASLKGHDDLWSVDLDTALALLDAKAAGKRAALKELGKHPTTGADVVVLEGRYGPYVTDGDVNATVPKDTDPAELTLDDALELLAERAGQKGRGRRSGKRTGGRRRTSKK